MAPNVWVTLSSRDSMLSTAPRKSPDMTYLLPLISSPPTVFCPACTSPPALTGPAKKPPPPVLSVPIW